MALNVLMMPDCRNANPYQDLLSAGVAEQGAVICFPQGDQRGLPLLRAVMAQPHLDILHLHWILPYLKGRSRWQKALYAIKLFIDIFLVQRLGIRVVWTVHNQISHDTPFPHLEQWIRRCLAR
jgi:beta-1,4-mannosyltransferase